jgi:orotidine-5'-phosphate decarboxylase
LCVGLDPTIEHVPPYFRRGIHGVTIGSIESYLFSVVNIAASRVVVVKPQYAYFAALGQDGLQLLTRIIKYAHELELLVILDAKRADIGDTMDAYGDEVFGEFGADACTFVPYLGPTFYPAWEYWLKKGKMPISMIRTSNSEAALLQDFKLENGMLVYEQMAIWVKMWDEMIREKTEGIGRVGGVVGATWPEQAPRCRELAGDDVFFLIPGYGTQGGGAEGAIGGLIDSHGEIMGTVNSSRGITLNSWWDKEKKVPRDGEPLDLVTAAMNVANKDLNSAIERRNHSRLICPECEQLLTTGGECPSCDLADVDGALRN